MSGVLNGLIESYVIDQTEILEHRTSQFQRLDDAIRAMQEHLGHRQSTIDPDFDDGPLSIFYDDGGDIHEHNF